MCQTDHVLMVASCVLILSSGASALLPQKKINWSISSSNGTDITEIGSGNELALGRLANVDTLGRKKFNLSSMVKCLEFSTLTCIL